MADKEIKHYTDKPNPEATDEILIQDAGGVTLKANLGNLHKMKFGWFNYNDAATTTTPIVHSGVGGFIKLTNDGLGAQTDISEGPTGMTKVWDTTAHEFDFSELSNADVVKVRIDLMVTTSGANQSVDVKIKFAIGGFSFDLTVAYAEYKTAGTYPLVGDIEFYIGGSNMIDFPAEAQIDSDASLSIVNNGFLCKITRR